MESGINIDTVLNSLRRKKVQCKKIRKRKNMMLIFGVGGNKFQEKRSTSKRSRGDCPLFLVAACHLNTWKKDVSLPCG